MKLYNDRGTIEITPEVFASLTGCVAMGCFGVKGMAAKNKASGIVSLLRGDNMTKGVKVVFADNMVAIELHIIVKYGINISAVCQSIISEVSYNVERLTGVKVSGVNIFVDSISAEQ